MAFVTTFSRCHSPVGSWLLVSDGEGLTGLYPESHRAIPDTAGWRRDDDWFAGVRDQLIAYFSGRLTRFSVPLRAAGTPFQRKVWAALCEIPLGATTSYGGLAAHLGLQATAARAVGAANGKNPISLIVPCHRVVGATGQLTGYAGGTELKQWLLEHEAGAARRAAGGITPIAMAPVTRRATQLVLS